MAQRTGKDAVILTIAGYDLRPYTTELTTFRREKVVEDNTVFGIVDQTQTSTALRRAALATKGFYDDKSLASIAAMLANYPNDSYVAGMVGLSGNTIGALATMFSGILQANFERAVKTGAFTHADAMYTVSGDGAGHKAIDEGVVLVPQAQILTAGAGAQNSYDTGQENTNGMVAYLFTQALALGGYTSITWRIEHSIDNGTFTTLGTFASAVIAAPNAQILRVAGTVHRYVRGFSVLNGAGFNLSTTPVIGFALNPIGIAAPAPLALGAPDSARRQIVGAGV